MEVLRWFELWLPWRTDRVGMGKFVIIFDANGLVVHCAIWLGMICERRMSIEKGRQAQIYRPSSDISYKN